MFWLPRLHYVKQPHSVLSIYISTWQRMRHKQNNNLLYMGRKWAGLEGGRPGSLPLLLRVELLGASVKKVPGGADVPSLLDAGHLLLLLWVHLQLCQAWRGGACQQFFQQSKAFGLILGGNAWDQAPHPGIRASGRYPSEAGRCV